MVCLRNDTTKSCGDSYEEEQSYRDREKYLQFVIGDGTCCINDYPPSSDEAELHHIREEVVELLSSHFFCSSIPAKFDRVDRHLHPMLEIMWSKSEEWHLLPSGKVIYL